MRDIEYKLIEKVTCNNKLIAIYKINIENNI